MLSYAAIVGHLVDCDEDSSLRVQPDGVLVVDQNGHIVHRGSKNQYKDLEEKYSLTEDAVIRLGQKEFLLPGLIDSHIHASQFPNNGLGLDRGLLSWLDTYTYPLERRYADTAFAQNAYASVVDATLAHGTTTAAYYATVHKEATEILCDVTLEKGQRAMIGKVCMNRNSPSDYIESTSDSLSGTRAFAEYVRQKNTDLAHAVVTPRFAIACDKELMVGLADIAKELDLRIQSHLSESKNEVSLMSTVEPWSRDYTEVYAQSGLMTEKTIMAHAIHVSDDELRVFKESKAGISHCPNSNCSLKSGNMSVVRARKFGVKVGLGTDCSGGYSPSMINAMRFSIATSHQVHFSDPNSPPLLFNDALYLATRGSAQVLNLEGVVGALRPGFQMDAIRVRLDGVNSPSTVLFNHETLEDLVQKFVFLGDDRNVVQVWVKGKIVKDTIGEEEEQ